MKINEFSLSPDVFSVLSYVDFAFALVRYHILIQFRIFFQIKRYKFVSFASAFCIESLSFHYARYFKKIMNNRVVSVRRMSECSPDYS